MKWNLRLGRFFGINVYLHFTFLLILGFLAFAYWAPTRSISAAVSGVLFFLAVFGCVLLHEYGHALTARRFGVGTRDITLLPIGGVARLERMPDKPLQEFWIAVAGPAVNVAIAILLIGVLWLGGHAFDWSVLNRRGGDFIQRLLAVNVFLVVFNLLPAFPMDGGRVLRSLLAMRTDYVKATAIAARLGQGMAFLFGLGGLFGNPMLLFIALFVWLGASSELGAARARTAFSGVPISHAMVTQYAVLHPWDTLGSAAQAVLAGSQQDFPVTDGDRVVGLLERRRLLEGLTRFGPDAPVERAMNRDFPVLAPWEMVESVVARQDLSRFPMLPVIANGRLLGLFTFENIAELVLIRSALREAQGNPTSDYDSKLPPLINRPGFSRA